MVRKIDLGCPVTPLEKLNSLSKYLGPQIYFKRDDLTGLGLGGNKVRKLEYLFWEASQLGTNVIISTASIQSNFLRILTAACKKMGWRCRLLVRGKRDTKLNGNYLIYKIMGAEIEYLDTADPFSRETLDLMEECRHEEIKKGNCPYLIHLGTYSAPLAILGYVDAFKEILTQAPNFFDHIFLAIGSGDTYAGLKIGMNINGIDTKIHSISVNLSKELLKKHVVEGIKGALKLLQQPFEGKFISDFLIDDSYIGSGGYEVPTVESLKAVKVVAETEGIILDPIYTGKAFAGLVDYIRKGLVKKEEKVLFLHTGGIPNIFFHADAFNQIL